jgi:hypothetical protein
MNRSLRVLSCGIVVGVGAVASGLAARAQECVCTKSGSPTAQEVQAKVAAENARDRASAQKQRADEIKEQAAAGSPDASMPIADAVERPSPGRYRVIVSFDPTGDGSGSAAAAELDRIVAAFERSAGQPLERRSLSRLTGGLSVCMPLSGLDAKQQQEFVSELRTRLVPRGPVYVDEHALCGRELRPAGQAHR